MLNPAESNAFQFASFLHSQTHLHLFFSRRFVVRERRGHAHMTFPSSSNNHQNKSPLLSLRERQLLVFGYPRKVSPGEVLSLVRFLVQDDDEEDNEEVKEETGKYVVKILDEVDVHGCSAAFVQLPRTTTRAQRFRAFERKIESGIQFEGENIYARAFDAPNRPEALKGLPRTVEEVFKKKEEEEAKTTIQTKKKTKKSAPEGYAIGGNVGGSDDGSGYGTKRKRDGPGPLLSLSENLIVAGGVDVVREEERRRLIRAEVSGGGVFTRDFDAVEFLEFDPATSQPGECERSSVKLVGRRGNNNVERKLAVVYAAEALSFFIGARGLAVRRMRNTFPTVAFECIEHPQRCVFLWQKGTGANGDEEVAKCEEILFEKAVLETIGTLERTTEEYDSLLSAKKVAARTSATSYDFRSQRSSEDTGFVVRTQSDSHPAPFVDKTPLPPPTANEYDHLYQNDDKEEEEEEKFENTNRILDGDDDDFGGTGFVGGDDEDGTYEKLDERTKVVSRNTPSPIEEELQDVDADAAKPEKNKDINSRLDVHRACSEKLVSRTDLLFVLGATNKDSGSITERFDLNERFVRVRMPKGKTVSASNYACGIVTKATMEPGRTKMHEVTWKLVLDLGLASVPSYITDVAYLSNDSFTQTETSAFADNLKTRDGEDVAMEMVFGP